ncbi:hypothetical protein RvY_11054 [Ramazzottius varieornatus]|uniref:InaF motif containing 2 n=1 Tax=Ramazzottius varieornatus TaxID=947166 RepID=A0A1D1VEU9_RAMVA|nr:hypothetical protein RvY_11054 [Ramazzottius varieornatus]
MPEELDRTVSYGSTMSSSTRADQGIVIKCKKDKVSPTSSSGSSGKAPTYTLQKAARMAARVNHRWVRIASVLAYLVAISSAGVVLALYYIFFYNPYASLQLTNPHDEAPKVFQPGDRHIRSAEDLTAAPNSPPYTYTSQ